MGKLMTGLMGVPDDDQCGVKLKDVMKITMWFPEGTEGTGSNWR